MTKDDARAAACGLALTQGINTLVVRLLDGTESNYIATHRDALGTLPPHRVACFVNLQGRVSFGDRITANLHIEDVAW